ncbi:MAG: alpha-L-rhamnosidase N-terminal domain-containing protein, partial [Phycisphaeraceae bacterium]|nr:alpha-L-rhamnosidase N-terminal domain-containing protein [Phycisphaeraceae bacterium]
AKAHLAITASSMYELFVNGTYIGRGPARCAPHHQSFDVLDVSKALRKGQNCLAVRVHYQRGGVSYNHSARAGLLVQMDGLSESIQTDATWRVLPDQAWHPESPSMARFHLEVCDRVDLRKQARGWTDIDFDDTRWKRASVLKREVGWPAPQKNDRPTHLITPWTTLVERDIPYLKERRIPAGDPIQVSSMRASQVGNDWVNAPTLARIPISRKGGVGGTIAANTSGQCRVFVYDFGEVKNGRPSLDIEAPAGTVVDVMAAPYLKDSDLLSPIVASLYVDRVVLSGQRDRWEAFYWKPTRWLAVVFRHLTGPATVHGVGLVQSEYPFEQKGHFQASQAPGLEALWNAAAKTIRVCTTDAYTDNYRERRQYAQTAFYACLGNYALFGDTTLQRRYLLQIAQEQLANGMMPAYAPRHGNDFMVILDSNCFWIKGLHQYFLHSGDAKTVRQLLPVARKLLGLLNSYVSAEGLIDSPPYPYWLDHAVNDRRGANFCLNGHYLGALENFAQVLDWLHEPDAHVFLARADKLRGSLRKHLWDPEQQLFADALVHGKRSTLFSEQANAMALAMDVATPTQAGAIARQLICKDSHDFIRRKSGLTMVTPAMSYYLHAGLAKHGYVSESFGMLQARFSRMLEPETNGTLWEEWWLDGTGRTGKLVKKLTRSDAQTESAFPPALFTEFFLGIRPTQPGLKEVLLCRSNSGLRNVEGSVPSPEGVLVVRWRFNQGTGGDLHVKVPGAMQVKLDTESLGVPSGGRIVVDGQVFKPAQKNTTHLMLSGGNHHVQF